MHNDKPLTEVQEVWEQGLNPAPPSLVDLDRDPLLDKEGEKNNNQRQESTSS